MRLCHFLIAVLMLVVGSLVGITGSGLGFLDRYGVIQANQKIISGYYQSIRGDEFGVLTPLCLSQMRHKPPFPVVNKTIDVEGKNMLIVHDFGVPVKHISTVARPTTWGYFTGSIRFGMAWNWLFPIFIGFVGISLLFNLLIGVYRINMLLALAIVFAPICSAWSYFSLYELGLGSVAVWSFLQVLKSDNCKLNVLLALLCGWAATAFVLTLYLPRLIPMSWLFIIFSLCIILKDELYKEFKGKIPFIAISILFICTIMAFWYFDAKDAIYAMLNSVYPGKRVVLGGTFSSFDFVRGWFPFQLVYYKAPISNQSELSSFPNLIFLIVSLIVFYKGSFKGSRIPLLFLGGLIFFFYIYQYVGFPEWLAQFTFFSRTHPRRVDSSIMLAQVLFLVYFIKNCYIGTEKSKNSFYCVFLTTILSGVIIYFTVNYRMDGAVKTYLLNNHREYLYIFFITYLFMVCFYVRNWLYGSICLLLIFAFPGVMFNPLSIAPQHINSNVPDYIAKTSGTNKCRLLFITGSRWEANSGYAVGQASLNGVHHYVDEYMFKNIYLKLPNGEQFNRFNHTRFYFDESISSFEVKARAHFIDWKVNPRTYNFSKLPIQYVAVKSKDKDR